MTIGYQAIVDTVTSHAQASGLFDAVNGHEPRSAPGTGLTCAVWVNSIHPVRTSGLNKVSIRLELQVRIYLPTRPEYGDRIDPKIVDAVDVLTAAYIGDFTLGDNCRGIDIFGSDGNSLRAIPGYVVQDNAQYRVFDIFVPVIINDVWTEAP